MSPLIEHFIYLFYHWCVTGNVTERESSMSAGLENIEVGGAMTSSAYFPIHLKIKLLRKRRKDLLDRLVIWQMYANHLPPGFDQRFIIAQRLRTDERAERQSFGGDVEIRS